MEMSFPLPTLDAEGYLVEPQDWNPALAEEFARQENIQLDEDHWDVIHFMRDYYDEHQVIPDARFAIKHLSARLGLRRAIDYSSFSPMAMSNRHARSPA